MHLTIRKFLKMHPQTEKMIYEKYPLSKGERRGCHIEKALRDNMRLEYGKKLIEQPKKDEQPATDTTLRSPEPEV